jgi:hypothetical protein
MAGEQPPQGPRVEPSPVQRRVEATPSAAVRRFEAQVYRRGYHPGGKEGIAEFEERVGAAIEAAVERVSEGA